MLVEQADDRQLIEEIARAQRDAIAQMLDAPVVRRAQPPDDAEDLVSLLEQELGEIRTILSCDARNERAFGHVVWNFTLE